MEMQCFSWDSSTSCHGEHPWVSHSASLWSSGTAWIHFDFTLSVSCKGCPRAHGVKRHPVFGQLNYTQKVCCFIAWISNATALQFKVLLWMKGNMNFKWIQGIKDTLGFWKSNQIAMGTCYQPSDSTANSLSKWTKKIKIKIKTAH